METKEKILYIDCPRCKKRTVFHGNPYRPFCSEGCKYIDLANWDDESYSIAGPAAATDDEQQNDY